MLLIFIANMVCIFVCEVSRWDLAAFHTCQRLALSLSFVTDLTFQCLNAYIWLHALSTYLWHLNPFELVFIYCFVAFAFHPRRFCLIFFILFGHVKIV